MTIQDSAGESAARLPLAELHSHLYGCLDASDLEELYQRRAPREQIYRDSYTRTHGQAPPDHVALFAGTAESRRLLDEHYYFTEPAPFPVFQTSFDLIISVAHTDPDELRDVCLRVGRHETADYAEYRMLLPPTDGPAEAREKLHALCEGLRAAEADTGRTLRLAPSLWRTPQLREQGYATLRECMRDFAAVSDYVCGIDFCHQEEGHPPKLKREFFARVLADNRARPEHALAILYHVGESFEDKSVESAARWVVEAAEAGAHRLGHAIALGMAPELFAEAPRCVRQELLSERLDQIAFELEHAQDLLAFGYPLDVPALRQESERLRGAAPEHDAAVMPTVEIDYRSAERREALRIFQDYAMQRVRATGAIIECCPTSNLRIARLERAENHPLRRFLAAGLPVVISADDPGILRTTLTAELRQLEQWPGVSADDLAVMRQRAWESRSGLLVGRERV